ncbi:hypothetical protein [Spirosoma agri]|uniref:Uncharacterized protein n=1 Tax=Spirosoma agri TaxID=1987381 RepID=A0A6M0IRJ0_9BACT|nr:hypothetical protein [Spirosoma agri]NEU70602.1 hypothetical protein [Spirosoma agri]
MYFAKITNSYNAKNRLQEYLSKQLKSLECLTVEDPKAFKKYLETTVHKANLKFPRCRPLVSYLHPAYSSSGFSAGVSDLIQFNLYELRGRFEPTQSPAPVHPNEMVQTSLFS